ncbi:alpha/beta hydrolase [Sphingomonas piscis]|uniref:Alpha/beta hydrolase n=2 Tax=Sphingomonas piscis TaxID=2714943 RepID=A0A6G7YT20_9SPHN|nr:alpha/beta hydrolase [Sphingomonas piscis]QIK79898.1 alpha/beta hydrolase [Sphingomonas piscis]
MTIAFERRGTGRPLLLVHGLGSTRHGWTTLFSKLEASRELVLIDLPGHGASPTEEDSHTFEGLARSLSEWLVSEKLVGVPMVGSSLGARLVLELARRGSTGPVVALDPGGFWQGWERTWAGSTLLASTNLVRAIRPAIPVLSRNPVSRSALLAQLSAKPWALDGDFVAGELIGLARTRTAKGLIRDLTRGPAQGGPAASGPITIGWGRHDHLCIPAQAERACRAFPGSRMVWFEHSGHFPMWDEPNATADLILEAT